jgi:hypothetical protein
MRIEDFSPTVPDATRRALIETFNFGFAELATAIIGGVSPSAHRTDALRKLLESKMTLIHGITHPRTIQYEGTVTTYDATTGRGLVTVKTTGRLDEDFPFVTDEFQAEDLKVGDRVRFAVNDSGFTTRLGKVG